MCVRVCMCGCSNVGHSFIIDYRAGRPVSACGAVPCSRRYNRMCVALPAACDIALWATAAQCYDLDNLSDAVAVASLDRALPCACMRVYTCTSILYNTVTDCVPPCAPCRQCYCGGCTGVCLSVCLSAATAASARHTGRFYAHMRGDADL